MLMPMSNVKQYGNDNDNVKSMSFIVFQVDTYQEEDVTLAYVQISQFGHLEINCIKIKVESNSQPDSYTHSTKINSFWTKTYQSSTDLPKRLFQMKSFQKLMSYFNNERVRMIQTQEKVKHDKKKLLFKLWISVTKNITDFVPLQLQMIEPDMIHYFLQADSQIFEHIHKKTLEILQQRRKMRKQEEIRNIEQKQRKSSNEHHGTLLEEVLQEGEMSSAQMGYVLVNSNNHGQQYDWKCSQLNHKNESNSCVAVDYADFQDNVQNKTYYYEESKQSKELLKQQYVNSLKENNQILLERVLRLQMELVKKNILLDAYQDHSSNFTHIDLLIEKKCKKKVQQSYKTVNSLIILFQNLKKCIKTHLNIEQDSYKKVLKQPRQEGEITTEKDLNKILSEIENAFEQFH